MIYKFETVDDFAVTLEYLAGSIGAETPAQLTSIARALQTIRWDFPAPEPLTKAGNFYGFGECVAARAVCYAELRANDTFSYARGLLEAAPGKPPVRKMCFLHQAAKLSRGFKLAAIRVGNGTAAYIENPVINEALACEFLKEGWNCLFVRKCARREAMDSCKER